MGEVIAIDKSRQHQLARKRELAAAEKAADIEMAKQWMENNKKMIRKERQKEQIIAKRNRNNAAALSKMAKEVKEKKKAEREATKAPTTICTRSRTESKKNSNATWRKKSRSTAEPAKMSKLWPMPFERERT